MKLAILFFLLSGCLQGELCAQQFISEGTIEYEVKTNLQKSISGDDTWDYLRKENLPTFKTGYYTLTFAGNKSMYKLDHWEPGLKLPTYMRERDETQYWYNDYNSGTAIYKKNNGEVPLIVVDSIRHLNWKLENDYRIIAGFNCRKAVAIVFDSVYIFAFYTEEILLPGGPMSINGLPGTVLGVTIPRLYSSWIATRVMTQDVKTRVVKPDASKKTYTFRTLTSLLNERMKTWDDEENSSDQKNRTMWNLLL